MANHVHAVLLDVDGTLVDSNDLHARAWTETLEERGHRVQFAEVRRLIGMGGDKLVPTLTGLPGDSKAATELGKACKERFMTRYLSAVKPFPRTRELLERLKRDGYRLAVASSSGREQLSGLLERAGVTDLIEKATNADDAQHSKPEPDIVQATLQKLGILPHEALMLGDTPYDVQAAGRAGTPIVAVRCGGWGDEELRGAVAVYDDPRSILEHYDGSPFACAPR